MTKKTLPSSKKHPGKIFSFLESWTKTKDCKDGTTVTFNQFSEDVQHSPAKKVKYECNICNKRTFDIARALRKHRSTCLVKHQQLVRAQNQALLGRLKEAKSKTPGALLYLAKSPEYNMPKRKSASPTASMPTATPLDRDSPTPPKAGRKNNKGSNSRQRYTAVKIISYVEQAELSIGAGKSLRETVLHNEWPEHFETMLGKGKGRWRHPDKLAALYAQVRDVKLRHLKKIVSPLNSRARYPELEKQLVAIIRHRRSKGGFVSRYFVIRRARILAKELGVNFKASYGWSWRFMRRNKNCPQEQVEQKTQGVGGASTRFEEVASQFSRNVETWRRRQT